MTVQGLHHITLICANAQRTANFYTQVLGQRLVKKTVNFDDPGSYHLYFGDETGRPGTAITFFEWPGAPKGQWGIQGMHHITAIGSDIQRTHTFFGELLGLRRVKMTSNFDDPNSAHWYWGVGNGRPGTLITYFERDSAKTRRMQMGAGQTHHFALAVPDAETQLAWREKLIKAGLRVSPVMDRVYFKSIYTNDPDGHIVELATAGPGFSVDEDVAHLGESLKLPPWLEAHRSEIERRLRPITVTSWRESEVG